MMRCHVALALAAWSLASAALAQFPQGHVQLAQGHGQLAQGHAQFPQGAPLGPFPQGASLSPFPQGSAMAQFAQNTGHSQFPFGTSLGQFPQGVSLFPQGPTHAQYAPGAPQFSKGTPLAQYPKLGLGQYQPRPGLGRPRPRWPPGPPGPPKQHYMYTKGPPQFYRGQKPLLKMPNAYSAGMFKSPLNFRPSGVKEIYRGPPMQSALVSNPSHQLLSESSPSHNLFTSQSPVHNLLAGQSSSHKLLSQSNQPYTFLTPQSGYLSPSAQIAKPSQSILSAQLQPLKTHLPLSLFTTPTSTIHSQSSGQSISYLSHQLAGPTGRPHAYPIRIDGEGGPIHTIPAPNLSLADKPIIVPEYSNHIDTQPSYSKSKLRGGNTYEVTEDTNDKSPAVGYQEQYKFFEDLEPHISASKLSPTKNHYSSAAKHPHAPQAQALQAQSVAPTLTSRELLHLLGGSHSQQQLADSYPLPLLQQPQLQQHFLQQTLDHGISLQPFNAVIQPSHGGSSQQNILFKPDPKYIQKIQEQFLKQSIFQPNYQTFNYVEPTVTRPESIGQSEALQADLHEDAHEESSKVHYNVVRNTKEGVPQENTFSGSESKNQTSNIIADSDTSDSYNIETKVRFLPTLLPDIEGKGYSKTIPKENTYYSHVGDSSGYFSTMSNSEVADTLATLQAADNLIKLTQNNDQKSTQSKYAVNLGPYFAQNTLPDNDKPEFVSQNNNVFTPIKGSPFSQKDEVFNANSNPAPIRIYVPDQYDDIETQPTENIKVSTSMNTNDNTNKFNFFESEETPNNRQDYDDYENVPDAENITSNPVTADTTEAKNTPEAEKETNDVVVTMQQNVTNPTLNIQTKDWKTSIVIKPKSSTSSAGTQVNRVAGFGNRIRPKRED